LQPKSPFAITVEDPQFEVDKGVWINGHLFLPALGELGLVTAAAMNECIKLRRRVDELLAANTAALLENRELRRNAAATTKGDIPVDIVQDISKDIHSEGTGAEADAATHPHRRAAA